MNIGIIGAGNIGFTAATLFTQAGHHVAIANSRGPQTMGDLISALGPNAHGATVQEAARFGEIVLVAIPLKDYATLPAADFAGRIVIDAMNYYPNRDGHYAELDRDEIASSQMVAAHLAGARVVKAFNTIWSEHLKMQRRPEMPVDQRRAIFVSGDDAEAKRKVMALIEQIGFGPYDLGDLAGSREQQPDTALYNRDITVAEARDIAPR